MENEIKFTLNRKLSKNQKWYYGGSFKLPDGTGYFMNVFESTSQNANGQYLTVYINPMTIVNKWNEVGKEVDANQEKMNLKNNKKEDDTPFVDDDINDLF